MGAVTGQVENVNHTVAPVGRVAQAQLGKFVPGAIVMHLQWLAVLSLQPAGRKVGHYPDSLVDVYFAAQAGIIVVRPGIA